MIRFESDTLDVLGRMSFASKRSILRHSFQETFLISAQDNARDDGGVAATRLLAATERIIASDTR